jgi:hypothetical protein
MFCFDSAVARQTVHDNNIIIFHPVGERCCAGVQDCQTLSYRYDVLGGIDTPAI